MVAVIVTATLGGLEFDHLKAIHFDYTPRDIDGRLVESEIVTVELSRIFTETTSFGYELELVSVITGDGAVPYRICDGMPKVPKTRHVAPAGSEVIVRFQMEPVK